MGYTMKIVRARAPLRVGFAGGGTDVSPYSDIYGGMVLNATINMFAHCTISQLTENSSTLRSLDLEKESLISRNITSQNDSQLLLHTAVYNKISKVYFDGAQLNIDVSTHSDAPPGSGLGSSSTLVVAMLKAYQEYFGLPLGEYDIAKLAFEIEREECGLVGGKQDQYSATFGGFNFMEFSADKTIVNPLRIRAAIRNELESHMLLYFTGISRNSSDIISDQILATQSDGGQLEALHRMKSIAVSMKEVLLKADIQGMRELLNNGWEAKKATSMQVSNIEIENISKIAFQAGAEAIKLSGAGGGGFMIIFASPLAIPKIASSLSKLKRGFIHKVHFTEQGAESWQCNRD